MDIENAANQIGSELFGSTQITTTSPTEGENNTPIVEQNADPIIGDNLSDGENSLQPVDQNLVAKNETSQEEVVPAVPEKPKAPETWRADAAQLWDTLPERAREEILKREADIFKGIEGYKQEAAIAKEFKQAVQPYAGLLHQLNLNPTQHVGNLLAMHNMLVLGSPQQKQELIQGLANQFNVQLDGYQTPVYIDPELDKTRTQLSTLEQQYNSLVAQQQQEKLQTAMSTIERFASDPKNTYFAELSNDITQILQSRVVTTIEDAYKLAMAKNPVVAEKERVRLQTEAVENAKKMEKARAAKAAKAASVNVNSSNKMVGGAAPVGSWEDTMKAKLAEINSRTNR